MTIKDIKSTDDLQIYLDEELTKMRAEREEEERKFKIQNKRMRRAVIFLWITIIILWVIFPILLHYWGVY